MITNAQMIDFIRGNTIGYRTWSDEQLGVYLNFYRIHNGISILTSSGKLVGLALARVVRRACDISRRWAWNEEGNFVCVDLAIAKNSIALPRLWKDAVDRFGIRLCIVFKRAKYKNRFSIWDFEKFHRRISHG